MFYSFEEMPVSDFFSRSIFTRLILAGDNPNCSTIIRIEQDFCSEEDRISCCDKSPIRGKLCGLGNPNGREGRGLRRETQLVPDKYPTQNNVNTDLLLIKTFYSPELFPTLAR